VWAEFEEGPHGSAVLRLYTGSRNRILSEYKDNAGFHNWVNQEDSLGEFFIKHGDKYILYGEWLVPHTVKTYRDSAWRKFYIFDVLDRESNTFIPYEQYVPLIEEFGLDYIPCIKKFKNGSWENFLYEANNCKYLIDTEKYPESVGEGVVIKNYEWKNAFNRQPWAKIVTQEFKDDNAKIFGPNLLETKSNASIICDKACTAALIEKEYQKIVTEVGGWYSKFIPRLLHTVFYSVVKEELWDCLKEIKYGQVNFKELQQLCIVKVKETKKELF
jgi:hypothetical protein